MEKYNVKKALRPLYSPTAKDFVLVDVPAMRFLAVDGHGDPNASTAYTEALAALYPAAYALKFLSKKELDRDYVVAPLEGLWWADDMAVFAAGEGSSRDKSAWDWTMMIGIPPWISDDLVKEVLARLATKKQLPGLARIRVADLAEGLSVQILHVGPYDAEGPVLARMHGQFMPANNLVFNGKHHEIYLGDPRRAAPEKLKTILRQPVAPAGATDWSAAPAGAITSCGPCGRRPPERSHRGRTNRLL